MAKKTFTLGDTLADVLGSVSDSDTRDALIYVPYDKLVADAENKYSMTGVDELARSIEIVGLLQPLRVFPIKSSDGHYKITSGHRRHAAIGELLKKGSTQFEKGVPCIEDGAPGSSALRELKLLLANADNRKMTPADEAQQAERISDCLRRLEDEGFEFPGRHRDWVAKLSGLSRTKIATIEAIRNNLIPELYEYFKKNELTQSAAYELQKLPKTAQTAIAESCKRSGDAYWIKYDAAEYCAQNAEELMKTDACTNGTPCDHQARRFVQALRCEYSFLRCTGKCCLKCSDLDRCGQPCKKAKAQKSEIKAEEKAKKQEREKEVAMLQKAEFQKQCEERRKQALRVLPLIELAGMSDEEELQGNYYYTKEKVGTIRKAAGGDFGDRKYFYGDDYKIIPQRADALVLWADKLGCSTDYLLGRTDNPTPPAAAPQQKECKELNFRSGTPDHDCLAWCIFEKPGDGEMCMQALFFDDCWHFYNIGASIDSECIGWIELPDYEHKLWKI